MAIHYEGTEVVNGVRRKVITAPHKAVVDSRDYKKKTSKPTKKAEKEATKQETDTFVEEQDNAQDN